MKQEFSSANTSINSTKLPAIYSKIDWKKVRDNWYEIHDEMSWPFVLDYGCGRYTEHIKEFLMLNSIGLIRHDPYWGSDWGWDKIEPAVIVCSNVLNVIKEDENIQEIIDVITKYNKPYFITVYEGNKSGEGKVTKDNCYQRNQKIKSYCKNFQRVYKNVITQDDYEVYLKQED